MFLGKKMSSMFECFCFLFPVGMVMMATQIASLPCNPCQRFWPPHLLKTEEGQLN